LEHRKLLGLLLIILLEVSTNLSDNANYYVKLYQTKKIGLHLLITAPFPSKTKLKIEKTWQKKEKIY